MEFGTIGPLLVLVIQLSRAVDAAAADNAEDIMRVDAAEKTDTEQGSPESWVGGRNDCQVTEAIWTAEF